MSVQKFPGASSAEYPPPQGGPQNKNYAQIASRLSFYSIHISRLTNRLLVGMYLT